MDSRAYHLRELDIARTPGDERRIMPPILRSHRRILDVGCGAGQTLIASRLDVGVEAAGIDLDRSALSLGRQLTDQVHFVCARGEALPFRREHFDLVISRVAIPYMRIHGALAEIWRVLKAGGDLWIVLHPLSMIVNGLLRHVARLEVRRAIYCTYVIANGMAFNVLGKEFHFPFNGDRYESFQTNRGITQALRSAGFENIRIDRGDFFVASAAKGLPRG